VLVAAAYLIYLPLSGYDTFYYDALGYWSVADTFGRPGHFDLLAYHEVVRGYGFPLILRAIRSAFAELGIGAVTTVRIAQGLLFALLGTQLLPRLVRRIFPEARITAPRILAFNALVFLFWRDYANFPLTDFTALALMTAAILLASSRRWVLVAIAGFLAGLTVNVRPAYALAAVALGAVAAWRARGRLAIPLPLAVLSAGLLFTAGAAVASAPQAAINRHAFHRTNAFPLADSWLSMLQLTLGLAYQKYETLAAPGAGVYFADPATAKLVRPETHVGDYGDYLGLVARNPLTMTAGYLRRTFNGLDVQYSSPYIRDLRHDRSALRSWLLYTLLFIAAITCLRGFARTMGRTDKALLGVFLLPVVAAITGKVEVRYMLPATLLVYALVCFARRSPVAGVAPRWRPALLASYVVFVLGCFALADDTYSLVQLERPSALTQQTTSGARAQPPAVSATRERRASAPRRPAARRPRRSARR
jgi:hypothetical protein